MFNKSHMGLLLCSPSTGPQSLTVTKTHEETRAMLTIAISILRHNNIGQVVHMLAGLQTSRMSVAGDNKALPSHILPLLYFSVLSCKVTIESRLGQPPTS